MAMVRKPIPGKDEGQWGKILNDFLDVSHKSNGMLKDGVVGEDNLSAGVRAKLGGSDGSGGNSTSAAHTTDYLELQNLPDLTLKADKADTYTKIEVDTSISGKADLIHVHTISNVTGLQTALDSKQPTGDYATNTALTDGLAGKSAVGHTHDDRYYTETEVDAALASKSDTGHTHSQYVENTDDRLSDARTPTAHDHAVADVTGLQAALGGALRVDEAQSLDGAQQAQGRANLGVGAASESGSASAYTKGDRVRVGDFAYITRPDAGTCYVAGGAPSAGAGEGYENVIGGNVDNVNTPTSNLAGAPTLTGQNGNWVAILGGYDNVVNGWACTVGGFHQKVSSGANHVTIAGGSIHEVPGTASYGTISGGRGNSVDNVGATVGGGTENAATGQNSVISGGIINIASATNTAVLGGVGNTASGQGATISGGQNNAASGNSSTVVGGLTNVASSTGATVVGGRSNVALGEYSVATGRDAVAHDPAQVVHAAQQFTAPGDAQINRWCLKKQTADATPQDLASYSASPTIPENTTWAFSALLVARRADVDGENAAWEIRGLLKRDAGNTAALVGAPIVTQIAANAGNAWAVSVANYSVGTLRFILTGEAAKTIRWVAELRAASVAG